MSPTSGRYPLLLAILFLAYWIVLAIAPRDRADWLLENLLAIVFAAILAASYKWLPLSGISYTMIFLFLCLHTLGAHHTYSEVLYDDWFRALTGGTLNQAMGWERNHFDRLVHFSYGLLLAYPIREVFLRVVDARGFWGYFLPLDVTMSTSMMFELFEWAVAVLYQGSAIKTHRDRVRFSPGRKEAAGDAGHRQGFLTPSGDKRTMSEQASRWASNQFAPARE